MIFSFTREGLFALMDEVVADRLRRLVPHLEFCACDAECLAEMFPVAYLRLYFGNFMEQM